MKTNNKKTPRFATAKPTMTTSRTITSDLKFKINLPVNTQNTKTGKADPTLMVNYGDNNLYPNYLLKLYSGSSLHSAIINSKVDYLLGEGVIYKQTQQLADFAVNDEDLIEDLARKLVKDWCIFNYYAIEVVYANDGSIFELNHLKAQNIRSNSTHTKFWYKEDWADGKTNTLTYDVWDPRAENNLESKVFFYSGYQPDVHTTYPTVEYSGALKSIEIDLAIKDFHLNNIHSGFSGNTFISFFRGEPEPEVKRQIVDSITGGYTGTQGSKIVFEFLDANEQAPTVTTLNATDWNDAYLTLRDDITEDIITAHSVTSGMLFGIKTEGQLGGATELETAYEIFKQLWVTSKKRELVNSLNKLMPKGQQIDFKTKEKLFKEELDPATKEKVYTINELRELDGKKPIAGGDRLLGDPYPEPEPTTQSFTTHNCSHSHNENLNFGRVEFTPEMELEFGKIGTPKEDMIIIEKHRFDKGQNVFEGNFLNDDVIGYLERNGKNLSGKSFSTILKDMNTELSRTFSMTALKEAYGRLVATRVIPNTQLLPNSDIDKIKADLGIKSDMPVSRVEVRFSYEGPADERNRDFCHIMVRANKLYSGEDIEKLSALFGYDVRLYVGGFSCRHHWQRQSVIQK